MEADRWNRIKTIFSDAADLPAAERASFLDQACAGDAELRAEVEKLLGQAAAAQTTAIFDQGVFHALSAGDVLDERFRIVRFVGKGGMGEVYEAEDRELKGRVALKILRPELYVDPEFLQRFRREVQVARQVTHANVCRIYDVGFDRHGDQHRVFLTMEFLDGETLAQRLQRLGRMQTADALPLVHQMAAGLGALHEQGIVHRDFKPGNVLVVRAPSGTERAVISDFGLARALEPTSGITMTRGDRVMGTPAYMAPEQLLGGTVTPASDIYALGLVMHEMVTGTKPFPGGSPFENAATALTPEWTSTIRRCLARMPEDRPQSAAEVVQGLSGIMPSAPSRRNWLLPTFAAILLAALGWGLRLKNDGKPLESQQLALLPLKVLSEDPALRVFAEGFMETITSRMSQFENGKAPLMVVPASEVRAQGAKTAADARQKFYANVAVEGMLEGQGDRLRLLLTLIDTKTKRQIETISLDDQRGNSWRLQDSAVTRLANALNTRLQAKYAGVQQTNSIAPGAYEFYLQARGYLQRNDQSQSRESAITLLKRAIELDPNFALAYSALGRAYLYQYMNTRDPRMMETALDTGNKAVQLNANLPETNITLGLIYYGTDRYQEARERFEKAITLDNRNHEAYQGLAKAYLGLKDYANAEATYIKAISMRPDDWTGYKALALFYYERSDYAKAVQQFQKVVELTPDNAQGYLNLGAANAGLEDWAAAEKALLKAVELDPKNQAAITNLGKVYLDERHETARAIDMYQRALALNSREYRTWGQIGRAYARAGQPAKAKEAFEKTVDLIDAELLINTKSVTLNSSLGFYRALLGRKDFGVAVDRAFELEPERGQTLLRAAESYAIAGDRRRASELLERALARGVTLKSVQRSEYLKDINRK